MLDYLFLLLMLVCAVWARVEHLQKTREDIDARGQAIGLVTTIAQIATVSFVLAVAIYGCEVADKADFDAPRLAELFTAVSRGWLLLFAFLFVPYAALWGLALVVDLFVFPREVEQEVEADDSFLEPY